MKKLLLLIFLPIISFGQIKTESTIFSLTQIDSIAEKTRKNLQASGLISIKQKRKIIGVKTIAKGGFFYALYYHTPEQIHNKETENIDLLIKAKYGEYLLYKDKHTEDLFAEFYYQNNFLFFVRLEQKSVIENIIQEYVYEIDMTQSIDSKIKEHFTFDIEKWILDKSNEFQDFKI